MKHIDWNVFSLCEVKGWFNVKQQKIENCEEEHWGQMGLNWAGVSDLELRPFKALYA